MGNVLDIPKSGDNISPDTEWLNLQNSAIFNDAYVAGIYDELPIFEGTEIDKVKMVLFILRFQCSAHYFPGFFRKQERGVDSKC